MANLLEILAEIFSFGGGAAKEGSGLRKAERMTGWLILAVFALAVVVGLVSSLL